MLIEPHKIEEKFFGRFLKNSFKLLLKNPVGWALFILLTFFIAAVFSNVPIFDNTNLVSIFFKIIIGLWLLFLGFEIAANTDYNSFKVVNLFQYMRISFKHSLQFIKNSIGYLVFLLIFLAILNFVFFGSSVDIVRNSHEANEEFKAYLYYFFNMSSLLFWGFILSIHGSRLFYYPLMRQFDMSEPMVAYKLSEKGCDINPSFKMFVNFGYPLMIILMPIYTLLIGTPFFIPLIPLIIYVAFREIFLNKTENEKEKVMVQIPNLQPAKISN